MSLIRDALLKGVPSVTAKEYYAFFLVFPILNAGSAIVGRVEARTRNAHSCDLEHPKISGMKQDTHFQALDSILLYRQPIATLEWALDSENIDRVEDSARSRN